MSVGVQGAQSLRDRLEEEDTFHLPKSQRLIDLDLDESLLRLVPESVARESTVLPVHSFGETIWLVCPNTGDLALEDQLTFLLNRRIRLIQRPASEIEGAINQFYGDCKLESVEKIVQCLDNDEWDDDQEFQASFGSKSRMMGRSCMGLKVRKTSKRKSGLPTQGNGMFYNTIAEGERVLAYRRDGTIEMLVGPKVVFKGWTRFAPMDHYVAHPGQFVRLQYHDGREETKVGPSEEWLDPRVHAAIEVDDCVDLAAKEAVVVYGGSRAGAESDENEQASRRIFYGPGQFCPKPGEWLHTFSWHASHGGHRGAEKRPNALKFTKLCLMPDQMYHDVPDVRTADDAVLTIRLMIFFELVDIERMLDTTRDPIGDFINAATSDVVEFTGKRTFEDFKQQTERLNELQTYQQLLHRAEQCGYKINNVVYRGYGAPDSLQAMHDEAIATRTRLQLDRDTERQAQDLEDYKLSCQMDRASRRREEQLAEIEHDLEMKRKRVEAELEEESRKQVFARDQKTAEENLAAEFKQRENEQQQTHLEALKAMGVELTSYLTQARADQVIELRGSGHTVPQLHVGSGSNGHHGKEKA